MKMVYRNIGLMFLMISPLFSALLTDDLEVISPTGIPLFHEYHEQVFFTSGSSYMITIRFVETSQGVLLVREYTRGGVVQLSHTIVTPGSSSLIINSFSGNVREGDIANKNVILE